MRIRSRVLTQLFSPSFLAAPALTQGLHVAWSKPV
jgi:hypothetical protein